MRIVTLAVGFTLAANQTALAQNSTRILTPTNDTCLAFTIAMERADQEQLLPLAGWALGFLSGVVQATGIDFLRNVSSQEAMSRLLSACRNQPTKSLSVASEEIAEALIVQSKR